MVGNARIFNPQQASKYLESLTNNQQLATLIRYNHELDWSSNRGLQPDEVKLVASKCRDLELQTLYELALNTIQNEGESTLLASNGNNDAAMPRSESTTLRKSYVLYAEKKNGLYNFLAAYAVQTKEYDSTKITAAKCAAFFTSIGLGASLGTLYGPVGSVVGGAVGTIGGVAAISAVNHKAYEDYRKEMPEAVFAYIFRELQEKQVLTISDNKFALRQN
jgi:hypothetical protein